MNNSKIVINRKNQIIPVKKWKKLKQSAKEEIRAKQYYWQNQLAK